MKLKKLLAVVLCFAMVLGIMSFTAFADDETEVVLDAGTYTSLNDYAGKTMTIKAADGADVVFEMGNSKPNLNGANLTFEGITFNWDNSNYHGLQHAGNLTYKNCVINGQVFLYGETETFENCTFNQDSSDAYNVWTYGAKKTDFIGCVFNSAGKSVLVYHESKANVLNVENTTFNASASVAGKAAIEIDTSLMNGETIVTVDDASEAVGFAEDTISGNSLWNVKKDPTKVESSTVVTVADNAVYEKTVSVVAKIGDKKYASLEAALSEATTGDTVVVFDDLAGLATVVNNGNSLEKITVKLGADFDLEGVEWTPIGNKTSQFKGYFDGDNHTISNLVVSGENNYAGLFGYIKGNGMAANTTPSVQNLTLDNVSVEGNYYVGALAGQSYTCHISNVTVNGNVEGVRYVGGISGHVYTYFDNCHYNGEVYGSFDAVGGIAGAGDARVYNSTVIGDVSGNNWVGGVIGNGQEGTSVVGCYVKSTVSTGSNWYRGVGGIAGVGGHGGYSNTFKDNYFDGEVYLCGEKVNAIVVGIINADSNEDILTTVEGNSWNTEYYSVDTPVLVVGEVSSNGTTEEWEAGAAENLTTSRNNNLVMLESDLEHVDTIYPDEVTIMSFSSLDSSDVERAAEANVVAKIGDTKYATIEEALAAIVDDTEITINEGTYDVELKISKSNVKVIASGDVKFTKAPSFTGKNYYIEGVDFEYNTASYNIYNGYGIFKNCNFIAKTNAFRWCYAKGDITFDGCKIVGGTYGIHFDDGKGYTLTIKDCEISGFNAFAGSFDKVIISGTKFYKDEASGYAHLNMWGDTSFDDCEFTPEFTLSSKTEDMTVEMEDCTVTDGSSVTERFGDVADEKGSVIIDGAYVSRFVKIGEEYYPSIEKAINAANPGDEIVIVKDIEEVIELAPATAVTLAATGTEPVVLNLSGNTLYGSVLVKAGYEKGLEIKNGNIVNEDSAVNAVESNVNVTLTDVNVKSARGAVRVEAGEFVINNGEFSLITTPGMTQNVVNVSGNSKVTINGGKFVGPAGTASDSGAVVTARDTANVTIDGGKFSGGKNNTITAKDGATITINAGLFDQDVTAYVATDAEVVHTGAYDYQYSVEDKAASAINVKLVKVTDSVYDIVLESADEFEINEFVSAELTFANTSVTVGGKAMQYEITGITDVTSAQRAAEEGKENQFLISVGMNDRISGASVVIGQVSFAGKGTVNFSVVSGEVDTTRQNTNLGRYYKVEDATLNIADAKITNGEIKEIKRDVTVNVAFNHNVRENAYWDNDKITVTIKDGFGNVKTKDVEITSIDAGICTFEEVQLGRLTVTLEAPGFRKYVYETTLEETTDNGTLVLNFWNDVKRTETEEIEAGKPEVAHNFVVGDIVMDYIVDIYDLAAVTSYYGTYGIDKTEAGKYIKYDLNRDGDIDIRDVQYVLHTMGN